jgi:hypothetical protein
MTIKPKKGKGIPSCIANESIIKEILKHLHFWERIARSAAPLKDAAL